MTSLKLAFMDLKETLRIRKRMMTPKLAIYDTWSREKIRDAKEDEDEDDDNYYSLYRR
jgi:hypothetical protein